MGVTGLTISATCFGLSNTFQGLVFSRALAGVLNANFAVLRGAMAEILDPSNFARTIAWLPITWSAGATIGSVDRAYMSSYPLNCLKALSWVDHCLIRTRNFRHSLATISSGSDIHICCPACSPLPFQLAPLFSRFSSLKRCQFCEITAGFDLTFV
jgi:MFS family permease